MSQRAVERTLGKLVTDERFREQFYQDPATACLRAGLNLSPRELEALLRTPREALGRLGETLDDRICRLHLGPPPPADEVPR
jgi:hypothetical protein